MTSTEFIVQWDSGRRFPTGKTAKKEFDQSHFYIGRVLLLKTHDVVIYKGYLPTRSASFVLCTATTRAKSGDLEPTKKVPRFTWRQAEPAAILTKQKDLRFPYNEALFRYFPESIPALLQLPVALLAKLHRLLSTLPWLLCFKRWMAPFVAVIPSKTPNGAPTRLKVATLRAARCSEAIEEFRLNPERVIVDALLFYAGVQKNQEHQGDTLFPTLCQQTSPEVYQFLLQQHAIVETEWGTVLTKDHEVAQKLVGGLERILHNARHLPAPRERGWVVPRLPAPALHEEQQAFAMHVMNHAVSLLNAPPGSGKTEMIVWINCTFERVLNVTFVGAMVEKMQERIGNHDGSVFTIHYVTTVAKFVKGAGDWLAQYDVIVIDEGSNVDERLLANLLAAVPNATKLVIVGDLNQIFPIDPGCPYNDLVRHFGSSTFVVNHRVDPAFTSLAAANSHIRDNQLAELQFTPQGPLRIHERNADYVAVLRLALAEFAASGTLRSVSDFQLVTLRNDDRVRLNEAAEQVAMEMGLLRQPSASQVVKLTPKTSLFPGKKICFSKTHKDYVRNGEIAIVRSCYEQGEDVIIETDRGKKILVSKFMDEAVKPMEIDCAYCITCNKSQGEQRSSFAPLAQCFYILLTCPWAGSEWPHVLFWIPASVIPFTREFAYVAFSRARQAVTVVGLRGELQQLCQGKARPRLTLLSSMLEQRIPERSTVCPAADIRTGLRSLMGLVVAEPGTPAARGLFPELRPAPKDASGSDEDGAPVGKRARK